METCQATQEDISANFNEIYDRNHDNLEGPELMAAVNHRLTLENYHRQCPRKLAALARLYHQMCRRERTLGARAGTVRVDALGTLPRTQ